MAYILKKLVLHEYPKLYGIWVNVSPQGLKLTLSSLW